MRMRGAFQFLPSLIFCTSVLPAWEDAGWEVVENELAELSIADSKEEDLVEVFHAFVEGPLSVGSVAVLDEESRTSSPIIDVSAEVDASASFPVDSTASEATVSESAVLENKVVAGQRREGSIPERTMIPSQRRPVQDLHTYYSTFPMYDAIVFESVHIFNGGAWQEDIPRPEEADHGGGLVNGQEENQDVLDEFIKETGVALAGVFGILQEEIRSIFS